MKDESGKVIFDAEEQAVVDKIIQERLARHKPEDYDDLKAIAAEIEEFNWKGTPAEKKAAIQAYKAEIKKQEELAALEEQAKTTGKDPELLKEIKALKDELKEIKGERTAQKQAEDQKKQATAAWQANVKEFQETFPDIDLEALEKNDKFIEFISGSGWTLKVGYEKFLKFHSDAEAEALKKAVSKQSRSTLGGKGGGDEGGGTYGLTAEEKAFVDEHNRRYGKDPKMKMTYKEFSERKRS